MPGATSPRSVTPTASTSGSAVSWSTRATARRAGIGHGPMEVHVDPVRQGVPDTSAALADRDEIERGLRHLEPEQRALLVLHYYLGMPMQETADSLGWPLGTVKSRLHRDDTSTARDARCRRAQRPSPGRFRMTPTDFDRQLTAWVRRPGPTPRA